MRKFALLVKLNFLVILLLGCATTSINSKLPNSTLSNLNPAPKTMSPPDIAEDPTIDPTYNQAQADYHYSLGEAYSLEGDSNKAIEEFRLTMVYDPRSVGVKLRLGAEYLRQGLLTEAVEQGEQAVHSEPDNTEARMFLGGLYTAIKMYRQAMEQYQFVHEKEPKNEEPPIYIGALYAEQDQFDEAERYFLKAGQIKNGEKSYLAHYCIGKMRFTQGKEFYTRAEKAFTQCLAMKPDFEDGVLALSELYSHRGEKARAIKLLESYQDQFGPKKSVAFQLSQIYLDQENYDKAFKHLRSLESFEPGNMNVKVKIALILIEKKRYDEAIDKLEEIISIAPSSDKIRFYLAAVYEEKEHYEMAIRNFTQIESTSTYFADAVIHAAYLYRKQNNIKAAADLLKKSIAARNDTPKFYAFYASILDEMKDYTTGVDLLEGAVEKFPDNTQLRFYLGSMYDRVGKTEKTVAELRKILAIDGDDVQALNYLAYTFAEQGKNLEEAEIMARKAMKLQPGDAFILDTVGWVLFKLGRVEEAIQYMEAANKVNPSESVIAEHLGDAYYVFELTDKARQMYQKAVENENDQAKINKLKSKIASIETQPKKRTPASESSR